MAVQVHLEGDGLVYKTETTAFNAAQIIGFLQNQDTQIPDSQPGLPGVPPVLNTARPRLSPREVLQRTGAKTNPQKIVVLGNYVAEQSGHEGFSLEEVKVMFRRAGEPMPKNFGRDAKEAITAGYIWEQDDDLYVLTDAAREYIQDGFPEASRTKAKPAPRRETARRTSGGTRSVMNEELYDRLKASNGSLGAYIGKRASAYAGKVSAQVAIIATWLLDDMKLEAISPADLQAVRRYLGEPTGNARSQITNAMVRDGYFSHRKEGRYYLSSKGEDFGRIKSLD